MPMVYIVSFSLRILPILPMSWKYITPLLILFLPNLHRHFIIGCRENNEVIAPGQPRDIDGGLRRPSGKRDGLPYPAVNAHNAEPGGSVGGRVGARNQGIAGDQSRVYIDRLLMADVERNDWAIRDATADVHDLQPVVNNS